MFLTSTRVPNASVPRGRSETFASTRIWPRSMSASRRADRAQQQLELLGVAAGLLGGPDVGLGDDLHERGARPVEVDQASTARPTRRPRRAWTSLAVSSSRWARVIGTVNGPSEVSIRSRPSAASGIAYWLIW